MPVMPVTPVMQQSCQLASWQVGKPCLRLTQQAALSWCVDEVACEQIQESSTQQSLSTAPNRALPAATFSAAEMHNKGSASVLLSWSRSL